MALPPSTFYQDLYTKWITYLATERPIKSFFLEGTENIREQRSTYMKLGSIENYTEYLLKRAQDECNSGGNLLAMGADCFDVMGGI